MDLPPCPICLADPEDDTYTCRHCRRVYHRSCMEEHLARDETRRCPNCRKALPPKKAAARDPPPQAVGAAEDRGPPPAAPPSSLGAVERLFGRPCGRPWAGLPATGLPRIKPGRGFR